MPKTSARSQWTEYLDHESLGLTLCPGFPLTARVHLGVFRGLGRGTATFDTLKETPDSRKRNPVYRVRQRVVGKA
jgi:hypothetical protein